MAQSSLLSGVERRSFSRVALGFEIAGTVAVVSPFLALQEARAPKACAASLALASGLLHLPQQSVPSLAEPSAGTSCWQVEHHMRPHLPGQ